MRNWLLFLHILGAATWLGGAIYVESLLAGARRTGDRRTVMRTTIRAVDANARLFAVAPAVTMVSGGWVVIDWLGLRGFERFWVWSSLVLTLAAVAIGAFHQVPRGKVLIALVDERGMEDPESVAAAGLLTAGSRAVTTILVIVLFLMVFKPT